MLNTHAGRQVRTETLAQRLRRPCHFDGVGRGLLDDAHTDHRHRIAPEQRPILHSALLDTGDLRHPHEMAVGAGPHDQIPKVRRRVVAAPHPGREQTILGLDASGRQLDVLGDQSVLDIRHRETTGRQGLAIQPDAHGVLQAATDAHPRNTRKNREAILQVTPRIIGEFQQIQFGAGEVHPHDDVVVGLHLLDVRWIGLFRQVVHHTRYPVADIVGCAVDVTAGIELNSDPRAPILRAAGDESDPFDAGNTVFDNLGNPGLHDCGRGAGIRGIHGDDGGIDIRVFAQCQALVGQGAECQHQQ